MKIQFNIGLFLVLSLLVLLAGCRKDHSTLDTNLLPEISIERNGVDEIEVYQLETLVINPVVNLDGAQEADLTYEWSINGIPGNIVMFDIGNSKKLEYEVTYRPNKAGDYYTLVCTITHKTTGLKYLTVYKVIVKNAIGQGLVIASSTDGMNSDLGHIMSPELTMGYTTSTVRQDIYSAVNGSKITGIVKQLNYYRTSGGPSIYAVTDNDLIRILTEDYSFLAKNEDLFYTVPDDFKPQAMYNSYQYNIVINGGLIYGSWFNTSPKIAAPFSNAFYVPDIIGLNPNSANVGTYSPPIVINYYDEVNGHFVFQAATNQFGDRTNYRTPSFPGQAFNANNLPNMKNIAAGYNSDRGFVHVLQDKGTNKFGVYIFDPGKADYGEPVVAPAPIDFRDLSDAPGIDQAKNFVILDDQKVIYYTSGDKIYAIVYSGATNVYGLRYTAPAGESITTLQMFQQAGYPIENPPFIATNNRQLVLSTYGTEGKVYLIPLSGFGLGNVDVTNIKTFTGFGKISAITSQL